MQVLHAHSVSHGVMVKSTTTERMFRMRTTPMIASPMICVVVSAGEWALKVCWGSTHILIAVCGVGESDVANGEKAEAEDGVAYG